MFSLYLSLFIYLSVIGSCLFPNPSFGYDSNPSTQESPDPRAVAIKPALLKLNELVILEIQKGVSALENKDLNTALRSFVTAIDIEPYDPMAYILLTRTLLSMGQEDLAYLWVERSGRNLSDSNQIITSLYESLSSLPQPPKPSQALVSIAQFKDDKKCAISLIFDDGEPSVATDILPALEKYGYLATIGINPGATEEGDGNIYRGNWDDWRKAQIRGHEIANHGTNHQALPGLSPDKLDAEVVASLNTIKEKLGESPSSFIYPEDKTTPEIVDFVQKHHLASRDHEFLRTIYDRIFIPVYGGKRFSIPTARLLIDIAMSRGLWLMPQCHGLYSPLIQKSFKAISPEMLEDQLAYIKQNEDSIWVGRFIDVFKYLKEYKETSLEIKKTDEDRTEFSLTTSLAPKTYSYPLTIVIHPSPKFEKAHAFDKTNSKEIPTRVAGDKIFLEAAPSNQIIEVQWN